MREAPSKDKANKFPHLIFIRFHRGIGEHRIKMKTFRFIGAAMLAAIMCVNFTSCSKDEDPIVEGAGDVVAGSKKLAKVVSDAETYTFNYDDEGRLTAASQVAFGGEYGDSYKYEYDFLWGDDVVKVNELYSEGSSSHKTSYTYTLEGGRIQSSSDGLTFTYNNSNKFVKGTDGDYTTAAIWDGTKLVSLSYNDGEELSLNYGKTCKNGYSPFIPLLVDFGCDILFMAHPEIAGMSTNQLPTSWSTNQKTVTVTYEFDKDGYVSKMAANLGGQSLTYTFTWK